MSYVYDRRTMSAEQTPTMDFSQVTRFFGKNKKAYAKFLSDKSGFEFEASDHIGRSFSGVEYRFWQKTNGDVQPASRVVIELSIQPSREEGKADIRAGATRNNRSLAWNYMASVPIDTIKRPHEIFNDKFFGDLVPSMRGSYDRELGEVQKAMVEIMATHRELDPMLIEVEKLVKADPVRNYEAIEKAAREASYKADSVGRSLKSLTDAIETVVNKK
jgi:hypothetical protein